MVHIQADHGTGDDERHRARGVGLPREALGLLACSGGNANGGSARGVRPPDKERIVWLCFRGPSQANVKPSAGGAAARGGEGRCCGGRLLRARGDGQERPGDGEAEPVEGRVALVGEGREEQDGEAEGGHEEAEEDGDPAGGVEVALVRRGGGRKVWSL